MTKLDKAIQDITEALEAEQNIRQLIASIHSSIVQIRQHQLDYGKDISQLEQSLLRVHKNETYEKLIRTQKFMQQLLQMESDQIRQLNDLTSRLNEASQATQNALAEEL
tara:strand:- start:202 stop:528 length:327 start_codon:yes stop_codon:yes gene_type:complete